MLMLVSWAAQEASKGWHERAACDDQEVWRASEIWWTYYESRGFMQNDRDMRQVTREHDWFALFN